MILRPVGNFNAVNSLPLRVAVFGDSLSANQSGYGPTPEIQQVDSNSNWVITKSNPCTIIFPSAHLITSPVGPHRFFGFIGIPELNELETTITVVNSTTISLDGVNSTSWPGTYVRGGRFIPLDNSTISVGPNSYLGVLNMLTGERFAFDPRFNRGVVGDPVTQFIARFDYDLPASLVGQIDMIFLNSTGRNDLNSSDSASTVLGRVNTALGLIRSRFGANFPVALGTTTPNNGASGAINTQCTSLNNSIRALDDANTFVLDFDAECNDGTGQWKTNYNVDTQHPAAMGGWACGQVARNKLVPRFGYGPGYILKAGNLLLNPGLTGTDGTPSGVTNNGWAGNWTNTISGTATRSVQKDANGFQTVTISAASGAGAGTFVFQQDVSSGLLVGTQYVNDCEVELVSCTLAGTAKLTRFGSALAGRTSPAISSVMHGPASGLPTQPMFANRMVTESALRPFFLRTKPLRLVTGQTSLRSTFIVGWDSTGGQVDIVVRLRNMQMYAI